MPGLCFPSHFTSVQWSAVPASLVAQRVKRLPAMQETRVQSLGREDPPEKEMATHSSTRAWRIPWTEEPGRLQSTGSLRVGHDWATSLSFSLQCNGLQSLLVAFMSCCFVGRGGGDQMLTCWPLLLQPRNPDPTAQVLRMPLLYSEQG